MRAFPPPAAVATAAADKEDNDVMEDGVMPNKRWAVGVIKPTPDVYRPRLLVPPIISISVLVHARTRNILNAIRVLSLFDTQTRTRLIRDDAAVVVVVVAVVVNDEVEDVALLSPPPCRHPYASCSAYVED